MEPSNPQPGRRVTKHDWVLLPLLVWVGLGVYLGITMPDIFTSDFTAHYTNNTGFSSSVIFLFFFFMTVLLILYIINIIMGRSIRAWARGVAYFFACGAVAIIVLIILGWTQSCFNLGGSQETCGVWVMFLLMVLIFNYFSLTVLISVQIVGIVSLVRSLLTNRWNVF